MLKNRKCGSLAVALMVLFAAPLITGEEIPTGNEHRELQPSKNIGQWSPRELRQIETPAGTVSKDELCFGSISGLTVSVFALMADGTYAPRGAFTVEGRGYQEKLVGVTFSTNCDFVTVGLSLDNRSARSGFVWNIFKYIKEENLWERIDQRSIVGRGNRISDDGKRTVACYTEVEDYTDVDSSCSVYNMVGKKWEAEELPADELFSAQISANGRVIVALGSSTQEPENRYHVYHWNKSGKWIERSVEVPGSGRRVVRMSRDGLVIAFRFEDRNWNKIIQAVKWDGSSKTYKDMGKTFSAKASELCGSNFELDASGSTLAIGCPGRSSKGLGSVRVLRYDSESDAWSQEEDQEVLAGVEKSERLGKESILLSPDGNLLLVDSRRAFHFGVTSDMTFTVPQDVKLRCGQDTSSSRTGVARATGTKACPLVDVTEEDSIIDLECGNIIERTWRATDACGNVKSEKQEIRLFDRIPPHLEIGQGAFIVGCNTVPDFTGKATALDQCDGEIPRSEMYVSPNNFTTSTVGTSKLTIGVKDRCGNAAEDDRLVVVPYNIRPKGVLARDPTILMNSFGQSQLKGAGQLFSCPSSLKAVKKTRSRIPLILKISDCQGNLVVSPESIKLEKPEVTDVFKFRGRGLKRLWKAASGTMELNKKGTKWISYLDVDRLEGVGCYVAEFRVMLPGKRVAYAYAYAEFKLN